MTDKELLEYAAKAAGYELQQGYGEPPEHCLFIVDAPGFDDGCVDWNPLTDDGDALRLAVELGLTIIQDTKDKVCAVHWTDVAGVHVAWKDSKYAATRQAIVRAAAEIGKNTSI